MGSTWTWKKIALGIVVAGGALSCVPGQVGVAFEVPSGPPPAPGPGFEMNVDRPGSDYRSFDLPAPQPEICQNQCYAEAPCVAFTYVNPGVQGPNARCWLKNSVPPPNPNGCCISGVKVGAPPPPPPAPPPPPPPAPMPQAFEPGINRPGMDYRNFELVRADPNICWNECQREPRCAAYTYVNPGVQGASARCWLKDAVPNARPDSCCVSGVKGGAAAPPAPPPEPGPRAFERGINRPGMDYRNFELVRPDPNICWNECQREPRCVAYTYVHPGVQGANARCWLKDAVPNPRPDACCVSGVK
ncbi:MAG: PAN domain-containing protein [Pseudomonadota bacterium]